MIKRIITFIFALFGVTFFVGCTPSSSPVEKKSGTLFVVSTIGMIDDLVGQIGGPFVTHTPLIKGEIDPHSYELVKGDDEILLEADLLFYNGLGLEHGASLLYQLKQHPCAVAPGEQVEQQRLLWQDKQIDPHIWMDISLWMEVARVVAEVLSQKDPAHSAQYANNAKICLAKMQRVHEVMKEKFHKIPTAKRHLVTSHEAFNYFVRAYFTEDLGETAWQERCAAPEGMAPDGQLSSIHLQRVIEFIKRRQVHCLFPESNVSAGALRKIEQSLRKEGYPIHLSQEALYGDSMGGMSYLEMMESNGKVIVKELACD